MQQQKNIIRRSNEIINCGSKLTIMEQRIIFFLLSQIEKEDKEFKVYKLHISELAKIFKITTTAIYTILKKTAKELLKKTITLKNDKSILYINWLSSAEYKKGEGIVELCFDPKLKPYLLDLKKCFTMYELNEINSFTNKYSWRIFEICKQYLEIGYRNISVKELKEFLDIEGNKYKLYKNFKRDILENTINEINEKTNIKISYSEIKTGRKITNIIFRIWEKTNNKCPECKGKGYIYKYAAFGEQIEKVKVPCEHCSRVRKVGC